MRRLPAIVCLSVVLLFAAAALIGAGDVVSQFGLDRQRAGAFVVEAIGSGSVPVQIVRGQLKSASEQVRAAVTEQAMVWAKAYVATPEFAKAYEKAREERKPPPPEAKASIDDEVKAQDAKADAELAEARKSIAKLPPEMRKDAEAALKTAMAQQQEIRKNSDYRKAQKQGMAEERANERKHYEDSLKQWQQDWPANPRVLVARRLQEFLAVSSNVDFGAKTVAKYGTAHFVNPEYERKPADWKLCYRAGRLPVERARAFAQAWLAELKK